MEKINFLNLEYIFAKIGDFFAWTLHLFGVNIGPYSKKIGDVNGGFGGESVGGSFGGSGETFVSDRISDGVNRLGAFGGFLDFLYIFSVIIIILLIILLIYWLLRIKELREERSEKMMEHFSTGIEEKEIPRNEKWEKIKELFYSDNPSNWRVAIMEADVMLEDLVDSLGYQGENLGDKMKKIEIPDFPTIQYAWDAHKTRNRIAHEGLDYEIDRREAHRVFKMYETVFVDAKFV